MSVLFVAGEVKAKARDFTQEQLERDIALSARLGADTHLLAAVDEVPSAVIRAAQTLADNAKLRLLVLGRRWLLDRTLDDSPAAGDS